jgi:hypothetical protein
MKKYIFGFLLIGFLNTNAQSISDYKYIVIPEKFSGFDENQYQLGRLLNLLLTKKNYEILSSEKFDWPAEVQKNPCLAIHADVQKIKSFLNNKLSLKFTDCNGKEIFNSEGMSRIKEYDKGYQDALRKAASSILMQNAKEQPEEQNEEKIVENSGEINPQITNPENNAYSNGEIILTKSELKDGSFLLIQPDNAQVYAQFFPTSKPGVYRVKMMNPKGESYFTVGYETGNSLSIELILNQNDVQVMEFRKLMR